MFQSILSRSWTGFGGGCFGITGVPFRVPGLMGQAGNFREEGQGFDPFGVQGIGHQTGMDPRPQQLS